MKNEQGAEKAALGIRYLLRYCETRRVDNFKVVKDCISDVRLWLLITFFCNNMDELWQNAPEFLLDDIFLMRPLKLNSDSLILSEEGYGRGFKSNSNLSFKEQFKKIRNSLSHNDFIFKDNLIHVYGDDGYKAVFDIIWLNKLTSALLSNDRLRLHKGMNDVSLISVVKNGDYSTSQILDFCKKGLINLYKVTALTSNKESIYKAINNPHIQLERCTFDWIFQSAISLMQNKRISTNQTKEELLKQLKIHFKDIENMFGGYIKLELVPINFIEEVLKREDFQTLDYMDKLQYLINYVKLQNPISYNAIIVDYLMSLLDKIETDSYQEKDLFLLIDSFNFLLKSYANICFNNFNNNYFLRQEYIENFNAECNFVHAKNVYKDYLRVLNRSLKDLQEHNGSFSAKQNVLDEIDFYTHSLDKAIQNLPYDNLAWNIRNSITHDHINIVDDNIRLYITGKNLRLKNFSKKHQKWEDIDFFNDKPIWSMVINKFKFLAMLDDLFKKHNVEIIVNISKYCKRSTYLK